MSRRLWNLRSEGVGVAFGVMVGVGIRVGAIVRVDVGVIAVVRVDCDCGSEA